MNLQVAFRYLLETLRDIEMVKDIRVLDEGALIVTLTPYSFDEEIAIYLLAGERSLGFIKMVVNGNSRVDIHTLFIVSSDLLPNDGTMCQPDESLRLLLDLYSDKVYAYRVTAREVHIFPVYIGHDGKVIHGEPVDITNLGSDYIELRTSKHIRGVRKIADFAARSYHHHTSSAASVRKNDPFQVYYDLLDVPLTATIDEIKKAYRHKARQHHPDTDKSPDATTKMQQINEAYDQITTRLNNVP